MEIDEFFANFLIKSILRKLSGKRNFSNTSKYFPGEKLCQRKLIPVDISFRRTTNKISLKHVSKVMSDDEIFAKIVCAIF